MDNREKRAKMMGEGKIPRVLLTLAIPAIISMLVQAAYNIADTIFVGRLGTSAIGAVSVAFPLFTLISAVGLTFGMGAASYISRLLGANNKPEADRTASTAFFTSMVLGIVFTILGLVFIEPVLKAFGATDTILPLAIDYSRIIIIGSVFTMLNMTMNNMVRAEGNARFAMIAISSGALVNIVLDPVFIFGFGMGIKGAAVATTLSKVVSFAININYFISGKSYVTVSTKYFSLSKKIYAEMMKIGIPTFIRQFLASISLGLINSAAMPYGDAAVAAMGVSLRVLMIGIMVVFGYCQGFQPVVGYNYGAKKYERVFDSIKVSLKWLTAFTTVVAVLQLVFAEQIMWAFSNDPEVIKLGASALRAVSILFPLFGFQNVFAFLFQALGKGAQAGILSLSRQGIFLIPTVLILPRIIGFNGVIYSQPVADLLTILVTAFLAIGVIRELKQEALKDGQGFGEAVPASLAGNE